jgi:hypothetical protein
VHPSVGSPGSRRARSRRTGSPSRGHDTARRRDAPRCVARYRSGWR